MFTRRELIIGAVSLGVGSVADGIRRSFTPFVHKEEPISLTERIRSFEEKNRNSRILSEPNLRDQYVELLSKWYMEIHSELFLQSRDHLTERDLRNSIKWIISSSDTQLRGNEGYGGWTEPRKNVTMNLTTESYTIEPRELPYSQFMYLRDTLTHEWTHYVTMIRDSATIVDIIRGFDEYRGFHKARVEGFRIYFEEDNKSADVFHNFDEASTALIAHYYQKDSGLPVLPPTYPDAEQPNKESSVETSIRYLQATLAFANISFDQFAGYHVFSDIDSLAIAFANATIIEFGSEEEKIQYGYEIINALDSANYAYIVNNYLRDVKGK